MTLVGRGLEVVISLDEHGVVDEQTQGVWEALETVFKDGIENFRIEDSLVVFGHGMGLVLLFKPHQTTCGRTLNTPVFWGDPMAGISGSSATLHGQKSRPSATSFYATLTEPYSVQTVARKGRSHRFRWIERMRGFDSLYPLFFHKAFTGEEL